MRTNGGWGALLRARQHRQLVEERLDQDREERVRTRAYEIWEREGRQEGGHEAHWQQAEQELRDEEPNEREQEEGRSSPTAAGEESGAAPAGSADTGAKRSPGSNQKEDPTRLDLGGKTA